jgi:hypothetical protein
MAWGYSDSQFRDWKKKHKGKKKKQRRKQFYDYKRDLAIVRHLETFYAKVKQGRNRAILLKEYSFIIVPNYISYNDRREQFKLMAYPKASCYVCRLRANHKHHIILLKHGGSNHPHNIIRLCIKCHENIHPYLNT